MPDHVVSAHAPPGHAVPAKKSGSWLLRVIVAVVAIAAVVWYLRSRHQEKTISQNATAGSGRAGGEGGGRRGGAGGGSGEGRVVPVQVAAVDKKDLPIWLEGLGSVAAVQQVTVRPQVDGRIDKVLFTEGQAVKKGDVLIQIDPRPFLVTLHQAQGAYARDKAQLDTLRVNLKRYEGLKAQNLVAGQQVEEIAGQVGQYEGTVKIDLAQIESAQLQLEYAQVKAPCDGITGVRQVDAGNLIHQSDTNGLVVITQIDPAAVFFTVPQDQLGGIAQAQARGEVTVEVYSRDGATKLATGKLAVLDNQINQTTATLRLKALVPNPNRLLWPNAFVKARMLVETRKDAITIPTVAIQRGPQGTYVYTVDDTKSAQMVPITVALSTGEVSVVSKGLAGGEKVIVEGQNQVRPGGKVEPSAPGQGAPQGERPGGGSGAGERGRHRSPASGSAGGSGGPMSPASAEHPGGPPSAGSASPDTPVTTPSAAGQPPRGAGQTASNQPAPSQP